MKERAAEKKEFSVVMEKILKAVESSKEEIQSLRKEVKVLNNKVDKAELQNRRLQLADRRKSKNLREMSYRDKFLISFGDCLLMPDHLETVLNRGTKKV